MTGDDADGIRKQKKITKKWCVFMIVFFSTCPFLLNALSVEFQISYGGLYNCHTCRLRDRKRKKFVGERETPKIRSESGQLIAATYKTGIYDDWVSKNKTEKFACISIHIRSE